MPHKPVTIRISDRSSQAHLRFGGGLIVNPETGNPADNTGDGLLVIDTAREEFLLVWEI